MFESLFRLSSYHFNPHAFPIMAVGMLIFSIGLLILIKTKKTVETLAFFFFCMSSTLWLVTIGFVYSSRDPQIALWIYKVFTFFGVINLTPTLYLFAASVSGLLKKQFKYVILTFVITYTIYVLALVTDKFITMPATGFFWGLYPHYEPWNYLFLITFAIVFFTSQAHLKLAYRREKIPVKRTQIRIIQISLLIGGSAFIDFTAKVSSLAVYPLGFISMFLLTCGLAYSIIRHRAFDIETVIHKTILWIASFSVIVIPIFVIYRWAFTVMKESFMAQSAFGIVSLIVFAVYLRQIQPKIDHFFQRRKANLEEISSKFADDLVHLKGVDSLIRRIEEVIASTLYAQWTDIFVYDKKKRHLAW